VGSISSCSFEALRVFPERRGDRQLLDQLAGVGSSGYTVLSVGVGDVASRVQVLSERHRALRGVSKRACGADERRGVEQGRRVVGAGPPAHVVDDRLVVGRVEPSVRTSATSPFQTRSASLPSSFR